jgi:hypothetical protein
MIRYVATNLTDLHKEPSFISELLTQVTNGVALEVLKDQDEKWCYVRQTDGYEGWAYTPFLTETPPLQPTHIVRFAWAFGTRERNTQNGNSPVTTYLLAGTRLHVAEQHGNNDAEGGGWCRVELLGRIPSIWVPSGYLRPVTELPLDPKIARSQIIMDARSLTGVYYLWGGGSTWGIDCSGLAQLCHRLSGYEIPRDCVLQFPVGRPIEPPFQKGDLLYFWNEARTKVGHVGIALGDGWKIIHSSRKNNGVYEEDVEQNANLKASYAGARSFLP